MLLLATGTISLVTAFITRDVIFAPLCCFGGMMFGIVQAAMMEGWGYAAPELTIPVSLVGSLPALALALVLRSKEIAPLV